MANKDNHIADSIPKDKEYRKVLKELGFEKPEEEPLTEQELRQVFIYMQEDSLIGMI